jgi:hypothetical protein
MQGSWREYSKGWLVEDRHFLNGGAISLTASDNNHRQTANQEGFQLLQFRVLRLGFFQDGDVGVSLLPQ